ncbi:MAG: ATP-grasp domain-containing protein [Patescibacteria group bacterium]|nr:ATP-grasp domain-containing protein [Patescibacteria group bacterium]
MTRTIVGILRGGTSGEYELSLKTGSAMHSALPEDQYDTRDIFVDKRGVWHARGMPVTASRALDQIDVVLNALHGGVGEDGSVQRVLERSGVPYAGSRAFSSALSLNKVRSREILKKAGVRIPRGTSFSLGNESLTTADMAQAVFSQFGPPYVIKPPSGGASLGIRFATTLHELPDAIGDVLDAFGGALVEEYIRGEEASVGIVEAFRGEDLYALPPAHVVLPEGHRHVAHEHHLNSLLRHIVPSAFSHAEKHALMDAARTAHRALGLGHFSRADLIVTPRTVYLLEINAVPGLYPGSSFPLMLDTVGSSVREFAELSLNLARSG